MAAARPSEISIDGACRGNPGPAGIGIAFLNPDGTAAQQYCQYIGETTNNVAEYLAFIGALQTALQLGLANILVRTDSQLLARQINGQYRVRHPRIVELYAAAKTLMSSFQSVTVKHVPREQNRIADKLANRAVDMRPSALVEVPRLASN